jgi:tetratricopeptide (TPR) repeat protein
VINRNETTYGISVKTILCITLCVLPFFAGCAVNNSASAADIQHNNKRQISPATLRAMARVYMAYGQYDKAEPLAQRALAVAEKTNATDDQLALCLVDLAYIYSSTGRLEQAEQKCRQGLKLQESFYGENHPYAAQTMRVLASVYQQQARYAQAQAVLEQAMDIMQKTICIADPRAVAPFQIDLANLFLAQTRYDEAETYFEKALPVVSETFGPKHLYTANLLANVAKLYVLQGRYSQAEMLITQAVAVQEKIYGQKNPLVAPAWLTMANVCWAKGDVTAAEKLIQRALTAIEKTGNVTQMVVMQRQVAQIHSITPAVAGLIAKAE